MGYDDLQIADGTAAQRAFLDLIAEEPASTRRKQLREQLLAYCKRDTEGMLRLYQALRE